MHDRRPARRAAVPGSATEDRLVEATLRCLAREGVAGTTAREITGEAGVNLAAITYHFGGKDHLVDRALLRAVRRLVDPVVAALDDPASAARSVGDAVRLVEDAVAAGGPPCALYAEAAARRARSETVRHGWDEIHGGLRAALARRLAELQDAGAVGREQEASALAARLVATVVGALVSATASSASEPEVVRALYESVLVDGPARRRRPTSAR
jgi:AcrR family transcriptional regulator